jgi:two-component system, OmpR family, alkaline phosphatase synthesis response regulator PhoP
LRRMSSTNAVKKILIADDEPDILEIVQYNLQNEGYEVLTAKNGNEAIEQAKRFNPDLIILDIMLRSSFF